MTEELLPAKGVEREGEQFQTSQLLSLSSPCSLPPAPYLVVLLNIGLLETPAARPLLGTIGFRNSHRGSW